MYYLTAFTVDVPQLIKQISEIITLYGINIVAAIAILFFGRIATGIIRRVIVSLMKKANVDPTIVSFGSHLTYFACMAFVVLAALDRLGVETASFIALVGAAGFAIGLAFQGALSNFAAGVLVLVFRPYKIGDYIQAAGESGSVKSIQIFTTTLMSPDNKTIIIPNAQVTGGNITNYTTAETRRVDLVVGVSYNDDLHKVKTVLKKILDEHELVLSEPAPTIGVLELADSSVNFAVRPWVKNSDYWSLYYDLNETIKREFDKEKICIPYPQRDLHVYQQK